MFCNIMCVYYMHFALSSRMFGDLFCRFQQIRRSHKFLVSFYGDGQKISEIWTELVVVLQDEFFVVQTDG